MRIIEDTWGSILIHRTCLFQAHTRALRDVMWVWLNMPKTRKVWELISVAVFGAVEDFEVECADHVLVKPCCLAEQEILHQSYGDFPTFHAVKIDVISGHLFWVVESLLMSGDMACSGDAVRLNAKFGGNEDVFFRVVDDGRLGSLCPGVCS